MHSTIPSVEHQLRPPPPLTVLRDHKMGVTRRQPKGKTLWPLDLTYVSVCGCDAFVFTSLCVCVCMCECVGVHVHNMHNTALLCHKHALLRGTCPNE